MCYWMSYRHQATPALAHRFTVAHYCSPPHIPSPSFRDSDKLVDLHIISSFVPGPFVLPRTATIARASLLHLSVRISLASLNDHFTSWQCPSLLLVFSVSVIFRGFPPLGNASLSLAGWALSLRSIQLYFSLLCFISSKSCDVLHLA